MNYNYVPLKITFDMQTPTCLTYPWIHFDAIIAHLMQRKLKGDNYRSLPSKRVVQIINNRVMPLKKTAGIYHASVSFFDTDETYTTTIYKRFCERHLDLHKLKKKKIRRNQGHFRDFMINLVYIPARKVIFYANGDVDAITELLGGLPGLGKKLSIGFGFINNFKIEEIDEDFSIVKNGKAMRPIPIPLVKYTSEVVLMVYKPPYWAKQRAAPCAPPGAFVQLDERHFYSDFKLGAVLEKMRGGIYGEKVA